MRAGRLRHRVAIQSSVETNDHGSVTQAWTTQATRWADIRPASGREREVANQQNQETTHIVEMRTPGIAVTSKMRLVYDSRTFEIESVRNPDELGERLLLDCVESS